MQPQDFDQTPGEDAEVADLYFNYVPLGMSEAEVRKVFASQGSIISFKLLTSKNGKFGYVKLAANEASAIAKLNKTLVADKMGHSNLISVSKNKR